MALTPGVGPEAIPFALFFPAVVLSAWYGGLGPGVVATLLSAALGKWFFMPLTHSWTMENAGTFLSLVTFLFSASIIVLAIERMHKVRSDQARQGLLTTLTLASIGDAVISTDEKGQVSFINAEAERLTGWKASEAVGQPLNAVFRIIDEKTRRPVETPVETVMQTGKMSRLATHTLLVAKDGKEIPIDDSAAPIHEMDRLAGGIVLVFRDVTQQRRAYEASAHLAAIVEHSGDVILTKNLDGVIQTWNASAERLFGYRAEEIVGRHVTTLFPPDRLQEEDHILGSLREGKSVERFETVRIVRDGTRIPVSVSVSPLKNRDGELIGASKVVHDITDLVAAREALKREKELLGTTLASIGDAVIVTDPQGRITFLNGEAERLTKWNNAEAVAQPLTTVFRIINEATRTAVDNPVEKALRMGGVVGLANHTILVAKDGAETPIDDSAAPIRHGDGPLFGVVLVFRDITEQKAAAQALREREQELEAVIDQTPFMLTRCSRDLRYRFVSHAYARMLGKQPHEIAGKPIIEIMGEVGFKTVQPHVEKVLLGHRVEYETEVDFLGVGKRYLHVVYVPDKDLQGNITGWIASLLEITERKEAERKLRDLAAALEEKVQQRTTKLRETIQELEGFSYSITHDLRAPLRAMQGFSNILIEDHSKALDQNGKDLLRRIGVAAVRMDKLVSDVLVYSQVLRMDLKVEPVDVDALLRGMLETYPNLQPPTVDIVIEGTLPAAIGNEAALTQCFSNLLSNAIKFVAAGVKPSVNISAERRNRKIRFWIADNGIGIDPLYRQAIFGMFQRLSSRYEGTGIGLTLVRKAAERMGGSVGVESELGRGSRFWLELPLAEP
jgi:PAS domain S-box-containing protein